MAYDFKAPQTTKLSGATDIAAAKTGYHVVLLGLAIKGGGKIQSNASTDLTDTLPDGYMHGGPRGVLLKSASGEKMNCTAGTGFAIWAYERG